MTKLQKQIIDYQLIEIYIPFSFQSPNLVMVLSGFSLEREFHFST
jgi:hypothetical protein